MAITLNETFLVRAHIDEVWAFVMDPRQVTACMPGAQLDEVVDERTFLGTVKVRVGAITASYRGRVQFVTVDEGERAVEMVAEGRETGGGTAKGGISSRLRSLGARETEVAVEASVEMTGRIAQVSRGMIEGVSKELFKQFATNVTARFESPEGAAAAPANQPIRLLPVLLRALRAAIARFVRRLFRRPGRTA
jgi:hypothetical protein